MILENTLILGNALIPKELDWWFAMVYWHLYRRLAIVSNQVLQQTSWLAQLFVLLAVALDACLGNELTCVCHFQREVFYQ